MQSVYWKIADKAKLTYSKRHDGEHVDEDKLCQYTRKNLPDQRRSTKTLSLSSMLVDTEAPSKKLETIEDPPQKRKKLATTAQYVQLKP